MASQLRLPEYRSAYRRRYHPYVGRRNPLYSDIVSGDSDDEEDFEPLPIADQEAEGILEPFFQGINHDTVAEDVRIADNEIKEGLRLVSVVDIVGMFRRLLRLLPVIEKDEPKAVNRTTD